MSRTTTLNTRGQWVPAIPLPLYVMAGVDHNPAQDKLRWEVAA